MTFLPRRFFEGGAGSGDHAHTGRKGVVGGSGASTNAKALDVALHNPDGFTVHVVTGEVPTTGYAVAGLGRELQIDVGKTVTARDITTYIDKNKDMLTQPKYFLGGWLEGQKLYLDVTQPMKGSMSAALQTAHDRNEVAIYGFKEGTSFYTMKDHARPDDRKSDNPLGESKAEPAKRTYFLFGKDLSPQATADTINKARDAAK